MILLVVNHGVDDHDGSSDDDDDDDDAGRADDDDRGRDRQAVTTLMKHLA